MNIWQRFKQAFQFPGGVTAGTYSIDDGIRRAVDTAIARFAGSNIDFRQEAGDLTLSSIVMAPVNLIGATLPEAPPQVVETDNKGNVQPIRDHPLVKLLERPTPFLAGTSLWEAFALDYVINGNVYLVKERNARRIPISLWWTPAQLLSPAWPDGPSVRFIDRYEYRVDNRIIKLKPEEICHFRYKPDGKTFGRLGMSPLASAMREIVGDAQWANYSVNLARNSGVPPFVLSPKPATDAMGLTEEEGRLLKEEFEAARTGDNRGKSVFLSVPIQANRLGLNPQEMDLGVLRYMAQETISSVMSIPAEVLNFGTAARHSTYNNVSEAREAYYEGFLKPLYFKIAETVNVQLLPDFHDGNVPENVYFTFDTTEISALQEDENKRAERMALLYFQGVIKRKTALAELGYDFDDTLDDLYITDLKSAPPKEDEDSEKEEEDVKLKTLPEGAPSEAEREEMLSSWLQHAPKPAQALYQRNGARQ